MPIFGLGIHILIAIFFAVHAVRTGRELYWLLILFSFPLLGSVVYFAVVFLPQSRLEHGLRKAGAAVQKSLDPNRELREAQHAFDLTPTAQNQMRLASALLDAGMTAQAVEQYEACLRGPFANDAEIGLGAARARLANGQPQAAVEQLLALRQKNPEFRPERLGMLLAQALAAAGRQAEAGAEYAALSERFAGIEVRAEYFLWAAQRGDAALAQRLLADVDHARKHMARHTRGMHGELFRRVDAARGRL